MTKPATKERDAQRAILQYLELRGVFAWRNNNGSVYDPTRKTFRSHSGLKGVADILGVLDDGRFLAIEVKGTRGKASAEQKVFIDMVNERGGVAGVCKTIEDVEELLK